MLSVKFVLQTENKFATDFMIKIILDKIKILLISEICGKKSAAKNNLGKKKAPKFRGFLFIS